jgi:hypothetical protein
MKRMEKIGYGRMPWGRNISSIVKNDVWDVVPKPKEKSIVSSKCIYKMKHVADGSIEKYKAIFVARGFSQKEGIDYDEKFSPMERYTSIRTIFSFCSNEMEGALDGCEDNHS